MSWKKSWRLAKTLPAGYSNFILRVHRKILRENAVLETKISFKSFSQPLMRIVGHSAKLSETIVKSALHTSKRSFWRQFKNFRVRNWISLAQFTMKDFSLFAKVSGRCVKIAFYLFREAVWGNMSFWRQKSVLSFWKLRGKLRTSWWTSFDRVAKTIYYMSGEKIQRFVVLYITFFYQCPRLS